MNIFKRILQKLFSGLGLFITTFFVFLPILWLSLTAFKQAKDAYSTSLFFNPTFQNYINIFSAPNNFGHLLLNSVIVAVITIIIAIPVASLAAYALSRFHYKVKNLLLIWLLSTQFIPPVVIVIPYFVLFRTLHLMDTRIALVLMNLSFVLPFATWMIKGFVDGLSITLEEAAFVEGCTFLQVITKITVPLAMPGIITTSIFTLIQSWNEYLFALILTRNNAVTLTVGLNSLVTDRGVIWEQMSAAGILIMVPIFIFSFLVRKHFTQGLTLGAVK